MVSVLKKGNKVSFNNNYFNAKIIKSPVDNEISINIRYEKDIIYTKIFKSVSDFKNSKLDFAEILHGLPVERIRFLLYLIERDTYTMVNADLNELIAAIKENC